MHTHSGDVMDESGEDNKGSLSQLSEHNVNGNSNCNWTSCALHHQITMGKQIFCNRSLNMKGIVAVGFDMDYTLAQYKPETFESLAYNGTVKKLVYSLGYPSEVCLVVKFTLPTYPFFFLNADI